jgi:aspartate/methionine/tyrosine aminotransferase
MRRLNDIFGATPVYAGEVLSAAAFEHLDVMRDRARRVVDTDRRLLDEFLAAHPETCTAPAHWGTTCFLRAPDGDATAFAERLRGEYETSVVPGRFFETPDRFRIGMGVNSAVFEEGLRRIAAALRD